MPGCAHRWLQQESLNKRSASFDVSGFDDVVYKAGTPRQLNGFDCGVFMTRTADYISRDAELDWTQDDMRYFRRRMVLEILNKALLEDEEVADEEEEEEE